MSGLIYFSVGDDLSYTELLKLNLSTLIRSGYTDDILIITDEDYRNSLSGQICVPNTVLYHTVKKYNKTKVYNAAANKLALESFEKIHQYDKIIFCDVDALWVNNPDKMFEALDQQHISFGGGFFVDRDPLISDSLDFWGASLLTDSEKQKIEEDQVVAANTGVFGLSRQTTSLLSDALMYMRAHENKVGSCIEQPFLNVCAWRQNKYNLALKKYAFNGAAKQSFIDKYSKYLEEYKDLCVVHFANGVGRFASKLELMRHFSAQYCPQ
jgi:hypothetical protein